MVAVHSYAIATNNTRQPQHRNQDRVSGSRPARNRVDRNADEAPHPTIRAQPSLPQDKQNRSESWPGRTVQTLRRQRAPILSSRRSLEKIAQTKRKSARRPRAPQQASAIDLRNKEMAQRPAHPVRSEQGTWATLVAREVERRLSPRGVPDRPLEDRRSDADGCACPDKINRHPDASGLDQDCPLRFHPRVLLHA